MQYMMGNFMKRIRGVNMMIAFKSLNLTFSNDDFEKLKHCKEVHEKKSQVRVNWENFVFEKVCGK